MQLNEVSFAGICKEDAKRQDSGSMVIACVTVVHTKEFRGKVTTAEMEVKAFGDTAHILLAARKGDNLFVRGSLSASPWVDNQGQPRQARAQIMANQAVILPREAAKPNTTASYGGPAKHSNHSQILDLDDPNIPF